MRWTLFLGCFFKFLSGLCFWDFTKSVSFYGFFLSIPCNSNSISRDVNKISMRRHWWKCWKRSCFPAPPAVFTFWLVANLKAGVSLILLNGQCCCWSLVRPEQTQAKAFNFITVDFFPGCCCSVSLRVTVMFFKQYCTTVTITFLGLTVVDPGHFSVTTLDWC